MKLNTERRGQRGQALVIIAFVIIAMVAFLGLTIDGGRIYVDRRVMQNAADAAALAAADAYEGSIVGSSPAPTCASNPSGANSTALTAGLKEFANQVQVSTGSFTQTGSGDPAVAPYVTYTSSPYAVTFRKVDGASINAQDPSACVFLATTAHTLGSVFIQVVNGQNTTAVTNKAAAISTQSLPIPGAILFLLDPCGAGGNSGSCSGTVNAPFPCGVGNGDSFSFSGNGQLEVNGSVATNGDLQSWTSNSIALSIYNNGRIVDNCDNSMSSNGNICWYTTVMPANPPACPANTGTSNFNGHAGTLSDLLGPKAIKWLANWLSPKLSSYSSTSLTDSLISTNVELAPGKYTSTTDPFPNGGCWFLEPGIYTWNGGFQSTAGQGMISNELEPPGGMDQSTPAPNGEDPVFGWDGGSGQVAGVGNSGCTGGISVGTSPCLLLCVPGGKTYYFRVTSARDEVIPGAACSAGCWRESFLSGTGASQCVSVNVGALTLENIQLAISNPPGMGQLPNVSGYTLKNDRYDIYANTTGCSAAANQWGFVTSVGLGTGGTQLQSGIGNCPAYPTLPALVTNQFTLATNAKGNVCTLGSTASSLLGSAQLPVTFAPSGTACVIQDSAPTNGSGCAPGYLGNPETSSTGSTIYDLANAQYCVTASTPGNYCSLLSPNSAYVSPGGVLYYVPSTSAISTAGNPPGANCVKENNNGNQHFVFGNVGLYDVVFYAPGDAAGGCLAQINGGSGGEFTGWGYMPCTTYYTAPTGCANTSESMSLSGGGTPFNGGLDVWQLSIGGNSNLNLPGNVPNLSVVLPLSARLIHCTNTTPGCQGS